MISEIIPGTIPINSSFIFRIHLCTVFPSPSFFLFLLSFQGSYHTVDGCIPVSLVHFGKRLQGILEGDGIGIRHQFVQHLGAMSQLWIILSVLVEQADCFVIAALGISISSGFPIQIAQTQQEYTLLYTVSGSLPVAFFVGIDGMQGIFLGQVDVADGIIYLVLIFLVLIRCRHALESADHLPAVARSQDLGDGDAGIKLQFVGRIEPDDVAESLISLLPVADGSLQLSHQIPLAGFLLVSHLMAYHLSEIGNRLPGIPRVDIVIGEGIIPFLLGTPVDGIALYVSDHIFCIVGPSQLDIAFGKPGARLAVDGRLGGVKAAHIGEGGSSSLEIPLLELRSAHQHPRFP